MSSITNIYELLPAYFRSKDVDQGYPLQALMQIISGKAVDLENNIRQLYDNWFIETCDEWVISYIGDLLGVQNFNPISGSSAISQRAYIANTLRYRRRKGIAPVLEQLANDVAGWRAHVVEFFRLLATTQYMNHVRIDHPVTADLRRMNQLDLLNTPFDTIAHTGDVRHISNGRGKHNIPNIGLFIWRIQSYRVEFGKAASANCLSGSSSEPPINSLYFTFSPLGYNQQLFNNPQTEIAITHISEEINLPVVLRRRVLYDELDARRQAIVDGVPYEPVFFGDDPVFKIFIGDNTTPVPPEEIIICNLESCCTPPKSITYQQLQSNGLYSPVSKPITVAVDPVTGKFMFSDPSITEARVSYSYGFSADIGSGTYARQDAVDEVSNQNILWQVGVSKTKKNVGQEKIFTTITDALNEWKKVNQNLGIISIMDNEIYDESIVIQMDEKKQLFIIAADWPSKINDLTGLEFRKPGIISADKLQPFIKGDVTINSLSQNQPDFDATTGGHLTINGLMISGKVKISKGNLGILNISSCTLAPESGGIEIGFDTNEVASNQWLKIAVTKSICGPVNLHETELESLTIEDSIIGNNSKWAILSIRAPLQLKRTTVFGKISSKTISADNCIFHDAVIAERKQEGCIRFSYVPLKDIKTLPETPRRFHCQPESEINAQIAEAKKAGISSPAEIDNIKNKVFESLVPAFVSTNFGQYAYAQLSADCPSQISAGADDGAEMGAFHLLMQPQRKANLSIALDEYLRVGLEAGIFFVT